MKIVIVKVIAILFVFISILPVSFANSNQSKTIPELIDIVGQQRMLVHQVLVSYTQIALLQSVEDPVRSRENAIKKFENNLYTLKNQQKFIIEVEEMQVLWSKFKVIARATSERHEMINLIKFNEQIIELSKKIISAMAPEGDKNVVNIAGNQRMLSLRIALFMLMEKWAFEDEYTVEIQTSLFQFLNNIYYLDAYENNTQKIDKNIVSMKKYFTALIDTLEKDINNRDYYLSVSRYTSQMFRNAKRTTKLYVDLNNEGRTNKKVALLNK